MQIESISRNVNMSEGVHATLKCQKEITAEIKSMKIEMGNLGIKEVGGVYAPPIPKARPDQILRNGQCASLRN